MDIKQAKQELRQTIRAYTARTEDGVWRIPREKQRPVLLMGPPGIGKTAILSQLAQEEHVGLVCYTMTHHTRQSALGTRIYFCISDNCFLRTVSSLFKVPINSDNCLD